MTDLLSASLLATVLVAALAGALPLLAAALGEAVGQRAGLLGLGLEGVILIAAFVTFAVSVGSGSRVLGAVIGIAAAIAAAALIAALTVVWGLDQTITGIAVTLGGTGLTGVLYARLYADAAPRLGAAPTLTVPGAAEIPVIGPALFDAPIFSWLVVVGVVVLARALRRSRWSRRLSAAGENPAALEATATSVMVVRVQAMLVWGACAGVAGAGMVLVTAGSFTAGMTGGLGYIAIVVAMLGRGRAGIVVAVSLGYGLIVAVGTLLQLLGVPLPSDVTAILPYLAVLAALVIAGRRGTLPAALGRAFTRGARS